MTHPVLAAPLPASGPSTKTWLVLLSLLSLLLLVGHWSQPAGGPVSATRNAARRVVLQSPAHLANGAPAAFAPAATL
ncbi:MAG: hypothetical protein EOO59_09565 [Hymenobacter sp.]|nr:MAG: hypothetical protein EOO59_09565 [Hymenobacter sp.]